MIQKTSQALINVDGNMEVLGTILREEGEGSEMERQVPSQAEPLFPKRRSLRKTFPLAPFTETQRGEPADLLEPLHRDQRCRLALFWSARPCLCLRKYSVGPSWCHSVTLRGGVGSLINTQELLYYFHSIQYSTAWDYNFSRYLDFFSLFIIHNNAAINTFILMCV